GAAIDDQLAGVLGDLRVEVVHEHPHGGLLRPPLARQRGAARGAYHPVCHTIIIAQQRPGSYAAPSSRGYRPPGATFPGHLAAAVGLSPHGRGVVLRVNWGTCLMLAEPLRF